MPCRDAKRVAEPAKLPGDRVPGVDGEAVQAAQRVGFHPDQPVPADDPSAWSAAGLRKARMRRRWPVARLSAATPGEPWRPGGHVRRPAIRRQAERHDLAGQRGRHRPPQVRAQVGRGRAAQNRCQAGWPAAGLPGRPLTGSVAGSLTGPVARTARLARQPARNRPAAGRAAGACAAAPGRAAASEHAASAAAASRPTAGPRRLPGPGAALTSRSHGRRECTRSSVTTARSRREPRRSSQCSRRRAPSPHTPSWHRNSGIP